MSPTAAPQLLLSQRFASFEELAASVIAWDFDFHQIGRNHSDTTLVQVQTGDILLSHLSCGCFSTHSGATPEDMCTIAVPDPGCPEFRYADRLIRKPAMLVTGPGRAFELIARPGYGISTFSVPKSAAEAYCKTNFDCLLDRLLSAPDGIIFVDPEIAIELQSLARALQKTAVEQSGSAGYIEPVQSIQSTLLDSVFHSLIEEGPAANDPGGSVRRRIFKRAMIFIEDRRHDPLSVNDLVTALNTTERTLERAFRQEFGISPKKYLCGQRLYGAHRQLWRSNRTENSVTDIANAWGFWHMGQFAKDYRRLFGELPSETLFRSN